ncbi:hypothetical protein AB833_12295 [Chromatiales bacterium (ex Bugula neritina AB1)]|nr:hypothetical protein AB833_12295 [Chromatiales bacterium (ex Bugula neritina AB1)]
MLCLVKSVHADIGPIKIIAPSQSDRPTFQTGDVAAGEYTGTRQTISGERLQSAGSSLAEVAAAESGVQFRQSGGLGSFSTVSLRGSSAQQVNVYLDGVLLNEAAGGGVNFSDIELLDAQQVDIYRGSVPVQLGDSAIGGAINITSRRASDVAGSRFLLEGGSFSSHRLSAAWNGPVRHRFVNSLVASFSHRASDNDFEFDFDNRTPRNPNDDTRERRNNSQSETSSALLKTGLDLGGGRKLDTVLQWFERDQGIANLLNSETATTQLLTSNVQLRTTLRNQLDSDGRASLWDFSVALKDEEFDDRNSQIGLSSQRILTNTEVLSLKYYREKVTDNGTIATTIKWRNERLDNEDLLQRNAGTRARRNRYDLASQYTRFFNDGAGTASLGFFASVVADDFQVLAQNGLQRDFSDVLFAPQLGLSHVLGRDFVFRAGISAQQRVPTFFELFGSQGLFEGNPELEKERAVNVETGLQWSRSFEHLEDLELGAVLFYGRRNDLISNVFDARGVGRSENISRADVSGVELDAVAVLDNGFSVNANLTFQDAENRSSISGFTGRQLPGEAQLDGQLGLAWQHRNWTFAYQYRLRFDSFYDSANLLPAADQRVHSAALTYRDSNWRVKLSLNNLTDDNFEDFNGFPKPGRSAFVSFIYQPEYREKI